MLAATTALLLLVEGCSRGPDPRAEQFVGKWKSSRMATAPLYLYDNSEWEIKNHEDTVMQYGVWRLEGRSIVWSIKLDGRITHERNPIVSVAQERFELREQDGSLTRFERLD